MTSTPEKHPIRVLLADDHRLFRQGLHEICETKGDFTVVGEAENGQEAIELAQQLQPDVILMDIQMPILNGVQATHLILENNPAVRIIILTMYRQDQYVFDAIKAGARGYLLKDVDWQDLIKAVEAVSRGEAIINSALAARVIEEFRQLEAQKTKLPADQDPADLQRLTPGEMEVLLLVAQGADNQDIAGQLALTEKTVTNRLTGIYKKLHLNNRTQAALYALRQGWVTLTPPE
ncbi:MAG: response regulator transcription factor [Anaerolineales bacterium]|nr:response regulator transcription factor [Anaerolineales bacterium]